jgi:DNA-binding NtrC family response regulator
VRELKHLVSRAVMLSHGDLVSSAGLALPIHASMANNLQSGSSASVTLDEAEKALIENALSQSNGNVSEAARLLGITRMTIRYRMDKHGIKSI